MHSTQSADVLSSVEPRPSLTDWLSRHTYAHFVPCSLAGSSPSVINFLSDLWHEAPLKVALVNTAIALVLLVLPVLTLRKPKLLFQLTLAEQDEFQTKLLTHRFYFLRVAGFAFRGNALIAAFRDARIRDELLPTPLYEPARPKTKTEPPLQPSTTLPDEVDYIVVGSGAGGAAVASSLAAKGKQVVVLEEGPWVQTASYREDLYSAMKSFFRDFGTQAARGRSIFPVMQGRCLGGSTVMNGAIMHDLPKSIYAEWAKDDGIAKHLPYELIQQHTRQLEQELGVVATWADTLPSLPVGKKLSELGWEHSVMRRNAPGCEHTGRCLQGCPSGGKWSMEVSLLPSAMRNGAMIFANHSVERLLREGNRVTAILVKQPSGEIKQIKIRKSVYVAAGVIHSPRLLRRSGVNSRALGRHLQLHLGVGVLSLLQRPVREWEGPPQGIEITEFSDDEIKLATQLLPPEMLFARVPFPVGKLKELYTLATHVSSWTASIRSQSEGTVGSAIRFTPTSQDMERVRTGIIKLGELAFAMGAKEFFPGINGEAPVIRDPSELKKLATASLDPRRYFLGVGHLFGTCRMGSDPAMSVVDPNFRVHGFRNLFVADASVFPSNIGVNPQLAISALARLSAEQQN